MNEDIKFLQGLQKELKEQETDGQGAPRFWTIYDYKEEVTECGFHDKVVINIPEYDFNGKYHEVVKFIQEERDIDNLEFELLNDYETLDDFLDLSESEKMKRLCEYVCDNIDSGAYIYHLVIRGFVVPNTMFLTKKEAKEHLKNNGHHYSDAAHTYAMTAWRSPTVEKLLKILENFDWKSIEMKNQEGGNHDETNV